MLRIDGAEDSTNYCPTSLSQDPNLKPAAASSEEATMKGAGGKD